MKNGENANQVLLELFELYHRAVYSFFLRHGFPPDDARDLSQVTFFRIHRSMANYRGEAKWTFVLQVARNVRKNAIRDRKAKGRSIPRKSVDDWESLPVSAQKNPHSGEAPETPEEAVLANERVEAVCSAILELPARMRQALHLQIYGNFSLAEIALAMGTTQDAVKALLRRARERLRRELSPRIGELL